MLCCLRSLIKLFWIYYTKITAEECIEKIVFTVSFIYSNVARLKTAFRLSILNKLSVNKLMRLFFSVEAIGMICTGTDC